MLLFQLLPTGFSNRNLRDHLAPLLGLQPADLTQGRMTYQLRCLRLHGMIERIPQPHRHRLTCLGLRTPGSSPEPTRVFFAPDWAPYCLDSPPPTQTFAAVSTNSIRNSMPGRQSKAGCLKT
jgi:hypothetical protein